MWETYCWRKNEPPQLIRQALKTVPSSARMTTEQILLSSTVTVSAERPFDFYVETEQRRDTPGLFGVPDKGTLYSGVLHGGIEDPICHTDRATFTALIAEDVLVMLVVRNRCGDLESICSELNLSAINEFRTAQILCPESDTEALTKLVELLHRPWDPYCWCDSCQEGKLLLDDPLDLISY